MSLKDGLPSGALKGSFGGIHENNTDNGSGHNKHIDENRSSKRPGRINLRAVAEVLSERGLDPTDEIVTILEARDDKGRYMLDADTRARIQLELLQYVQPKLKSIEIKGKLATTTFDVNDEQAMRIAQEFLKASIDEEASE